MLEILSEEEKEESINNDDQANNIMNVHEAKSINKKIKFNKRSFNFNIKS
jgi:hypothetical protein